MLKHGQKVIAEFERSNGEISPVKCTVWIEGSKVFLCQDMFDGMATTLTHPRRFSWFVGYHSFDGMQDAVRAYRIKTIVEGANEYTP